MRNRTLLSALKWLTALTGAFDCLAVAFLFSLNQSIPGKPFANLWPIPGLYFIELIALAGLAIAFIVEQPKPTVFSSPRVPWVSAGIILAFVILGAWSIGPFLLPALLAFLLLGVLEDLSRSFNANWEIVPYLLIALLLLGLAILGAWAIESPLIVSATLLIIGLLIIFLLESASARNATLNHLAYLSIGGFAQALIVYLFAAF